MSIRTFATYESLMVEVNNVAEKLHQEIKAAVNEIRVNKPKCSTMFGSLYFADFDDPDGYKPALTVKVVYVPFWGIQYVTTDGRQYSNNNGGIDDLLRNARPHGLPVEGSYFLRSENEQLEAP